MGEYRTILTSLFKRMLVAAPFFAVGFMAFFKGGSGGMAGGLGFGLLGCAALIVGAIIVAFPLAGLIAEPSGGLLFPEKRFDRAPPVYSLPQSKRARGQYEEAIAGFEKIAEEFPEEVKPWIEMIDLAIVDLADAERARSIYERGLAALAKEEDRRLLQKMYEAIRTQLHTKPTGHAGGGKIEC